MMAPTEIEQTCPGCGLSRSQWRGNGGEGYSKGGELYCCRECAESTGCTCREAGPA